MQWGQDRRLGIWDALPPRLTGKMTQLVMGGSFFHLIMLVDRTLQFGIQRLRTVKDRRAANLRRTESKSGAGGTVINVRNASGHDTRGIFAVQFDAQQNQNAVI